MYMVIADCCLSLLIYVTG